MIEAHDLTKRFDGFTALDHINCSIPSGCIYGMVGSNGAGKSTFLRLASGVYRGEEGSVTIDGEPVYENPAAKAKLAYIPDDLFFLHGGSLSRMQKMYASLFPQFNTARFHELTAAFRLDENRPIGTFSKGMKRQAAIILALSRQPQYLFFDETFDGLDPVMRSLVKGLICEDVLQRGITVIVTSHSLRELEDLCDQLALLHLGGLVLQSDVQNLKTSLFKVQVAFTGGQVPEGAFDGFDVQRFTQEGSVCHLIMHGDREQALTRLNSLSPILLDVLPLSLEEVFTFEMSQRGYAFDDVLKKEVAAS